MLGRLRRKGDAVDQVTPSNFERFDREPNRSCKRLNTWWQRTGRSRPSLRAVPSGIVTSLGDMPDGISRQPGVERLKCEKSSSHWVQSSAVPATHRDQHGQVLWVLQGLHLIIIHFWQVIYYSARILMMSGISSDMTMILWLSALVSAVNFFASFLGACPPSHSVLETLFYFGRDGSDRQTGKASSLPRILHRNSSVSPCHWGWLSTFRVHTIN